MDYTAIIEGTVKFRDGKKWKSRWCVVRKISPVADCLHVQLYRDSKDRYKQGQTKASLSLQHFLGVETGFTLDKESNTIAILCQDVTVVLAFDTRERLIQWQVKIANNLGEDQQYLIQVGAAPPKTKISPGPARLHIQEYSFALTMGVPPRPIGVWSISHLRRYGVVDNRFVFEGGSGCGRYEGVYVLVTDQGQAICQAFRAASQGRLIPKRKQLSRNHSLVESPRKQAVTRLKTDQESILQEWGEGRGSEFGDTVSVSELNMETQEGWSGAGPELVAACRGCLSKTAGMTRSLTVSNTPGTGFNPAWIMEQNGCEHQITRNTICCNISVISHTTCHSDSNSTKSTSDDSGCSRSRAMSPCDVRPPPHHRLLSQTESVHYENYDTPRSLSVTLKDQLVGNRSSVASSGSEMEYYDTPRKVRECLVGPGRPACVSPPPAPHLHHPHPHHQLHRVECSCHVLLCPCQKVLCGPQPVLLCSCTSDRLPTTIQTDWEEPCGAANEAVYAKVDPLKKTRRRVETSPETSPGRPPLPPPAAPLNYANLQFAQSLAHYENVRDLKVNNLDHHPKCLCAAKVEPEFPGEDYLVMGPVAAEGKSPGYIHMNPIKCGPDQCAPIKDPCAPPSGTPQSATASPCLRRLKPTSSYATEEGRRMAQIRRRSNSVESGRCLEGLGLDCMGERTVSSQSTLAPNSHGNSSSNSHDSLPDQFAALTTTAPVLPPSATFMVSRRICGPASKSNRDSSSSNDSGVSTGSFKNFEAGFLEFETIETPLSKVRRRVVCPRRSKSSDPLEEAIFTSEQPQHKSSSAGAELPQHPTKDLTVTNSSGAMTIPYVDSISTSSGASDMSDYIETLSMSSFSSSEQDNLRQCHSAVTILRPRSGKEYHKIDRTNIEEGKQKKAGVEPAPDCVSSASSN